MANIQKRGNSYRFRVSAGYDASGKQIVKTMTWTPPEGMTAKKAEKEAQHEAALFEEQVRNGQIADGKLKFSVFAKRWFIDYAEVQLRPRTIARYKNLMERIDPAIGHLYMEKITPTHLMQFYKELSNTSCGVKCRCKVDLKLHLKQIRLTKSACAISAGVSLAVLSSAFHGNNIEVDSGEKISKAIGLPFSEVFELVNNEKKLSSKTVKEYHQLISSIMHTAVKWQIIVSNPCERVAPPKVQKTDAEYLDADQAIKLMELLETAPNQYRTSVIVLLFTGMRRGELLGLEWSDIDYDKQTINISKSSLYISGCGIFDDDTKNNSSNRVIKVAQTVIQTLQEHRQWQLKQQLTLGTMWKNSNKVFTAVDGSPMHPDTLSSWFNRFITTHSDELPQIHIHSLRHTCATLNIANGVAVTTVAGQLGHANATTTTKIYAHAIKTAQAQAADMMDSILAPNKKMV